eukprot:scaffold256_cov261-Pinguiococcus_pyrenoidosus.AAC.19
MARALIGFAAALDFCAAPFESTAREIPKRVAATRFQPRRALVQSLAELWGQGRASSSPEASIGASIV